MPTSLPVNPTPRRSDISGAATARALPERPFGALLRSLCILALAALAACSSSRDSSRRTSHDSSATGDATEQVDTTPYSEAYEPTLGERLGRLDALMRTAPPDSLPLLQEEYRRLLAEEAEYEEEEEEEDDEEIQTGNPAEPQPYVSQPRRNVDKAYEGMQGFRNSEISVAEGGSAEPARPRVSTHRRTAGSKSMAKTSTKTTGRSRTKRTARAREERAEETGAEETRAAQPSSTRERDGRFVNGLAASRAGRYAEAAEQLPAVVDAPPPGKKKLAQYSYGEALEKTGKVDKAGEQYRKASGGNGELAHKSYISYCRTLARSGKRDEARKLLVQFINQHPKSSQVVSARQLLQTL